MLQPGGAVVAIPKANGPYEDTIVTIPNAKDTVTAISKVKYSKK